jgi:hypothetical protein
MVLLQYDIYNYRCDLNFIYNHHATGKEEFGYDSIKFCPQHTLSSIYYLSLSRGPIAER